MDPIQILLIVVLTLSTIFLTVIGIQLLSVLSEFRKTLQNVNKIVDSFDSLGVGLHQGLSEATGFINGFKTLLKAVELFTHKKNDSGT